jgi:hypothetical protein
VEAFIALEGLYLQALLFVPLCLQLYLPAILSWTPYILLKGIDKHIEGIIVAGG